MSRGKRPVAAIGEAKRSAAAAGFQLIELVTELELLFDFVVRMDGVVSLVRIRRLKFAGFRIENIQRHCAEPIADLRAVGMPEGLVRELWVRGPARAFHRYWILPDTIKEIGIVNQPKEIRISTVPDSAVSAQTVTVKDMSQLSGNPAEQSGTYVSS
jgi:hypothetical protein